MNEEAKTIDKNSAIPAYYQLAKIFEEMITQGELGPDMPLPPEHAIAARYEISRMTVRQAIAELVGMGLVYTQKGKGTFVARPALDNVAFELGDFFTEIRKRGLVPAISLLEARIVKADAGVAGRLACTPGTRCLYYRFTLSAGGEHLAYETRYVVYVRQKPLLEAELKDPSLARLVSTYSDKMPVTCKRVLQAGAVTAQEADILEVAPGTPAFLVEQTLYDRDRQPIGWGRSVYRGDRCKLTSYEGWNKEEFHAGMVNLD